MIMPIDHKFEINQRRRSGPETTSTILNEGRILNDFLAGMHGLQDQRDLNPLKVNRLTYSRRQERDLMEKAEIEELQFNNLAPIEDFLRPTSVTTPRQTGYETGHIRSLLKTDIVRAYTSLIVYNLTVSVCVYCSSVPRRRQ